MSFRHMYCPASRFAAVCLAILLLLPGCGVELPPHQSEPQGHTYNWGKRIYFGIGGNLHRFARSGWSHREEGGTWTEALAASLILQVRPAHEPVTLELAAGGFVHLPGIPFQTVEVSVNGQKIATWRVNEHRTYRAVIPREFVGGERTLFSGHPTDPRAKALLLIDFYLPNSQVPVLVGAGGDWRRLGMNCSEMRLVVGSDPAAAQDDIAASGPQSEEGSTYTPGTVVRFAAGENASRYKLSGWHQAEPALTWSSAQPALLGFKLAGAKADGPLTLKLKANGNILPPRLPAQRTIVRANDQQIAEWRITEVAEFKAVIPPDLIRTDRLLTLEFVNPDATSPKELGVSQDTRKLGIACFELSLLQEE
jgi:hypothetical protein